MSEAKKGGLIHFISQAWLVILLAMIFGGALAGIEIALKDRIAQNKLEKTLRQVPTIFEGAPQDKAEPVEMTIGGKKQTVYKVHDQAGTHIGWLIPGSGQGFADKIELLVGVNAELDTIVDIAILKQSETPGLGDYITKESKPFRKDYGKGLAADTPVTVVKNREGDPAKNEVQAISGATVSSESVTRIVNKTLREFWQAYRKKKDGLE